MTNEQTAEDQPVQVEDVVEEEAPVVEADAEENAEVEASAPSAEVDAGAAGDVEQASVDPEVQAFIGQDTTVVHDEPEGDGVIPTEFRTPPGIPSGLDPGTPQERAAD